MSLLNILPYTAKAFENIYQEEFMAGFTHSSLAKGPADLRKASQFVERLIEGAQRMKLPCTFSQKMLKGNELEGGACTAISFRVAKEALNLLRLLRGNLQLKAVNRDKCFISHLSRYVRELEEIANGGNKLLEKSEQISVRTEQLALNTIMVERHVSMRTSNAVSEKVGAMAPFYGLKVTGSSSELRVKGNEQLEAQLSEQIRSLNEGVYVLRIIQEKYNHKLEEKGHSIVYIKTAGGEYYFDPALGCYQLFSEVAKPSLIYNALLSANNKFGVDVLSFHCLVEEKPILSASLTVPDLNLTGVVHMPCDSVGKSPIVIFSPALDEPVCAYQAIAEGLSAKGFCVICVDYSRTGFDTQKLEEAEIIKLGLRNGDAIEKLVALIRKGYFENIPSNQAIGVLGHSLGGSASIEACRRTSEIQAAINMDGRILDPTGILQPVLQMVAKRVKKDEDRTAYKAALLELARNNPLLYTSEVDANHGDFSSSFYGFLNHIICECDGFFKKNLPYGEKV